MARKVIIDGDPGIDTAVALCMALCDPRLEVVAITACSGNVTDEQSTLNVQAIIDLIDPPLRPRVGQARAPANAPAIDLSHIHGKDGLGGANIPVSQLHHAHPAEKVIVDTVRDAPGEVDLLALGPLTNISRAMRLDPELPHALGQVIMMGGSVECIGNVTPAAEFNMFFDPQAAKSVFRSPATKTLIPLDVTTEVVFTLDLIDQLPRDISRAGKFLRAAVPHLFRSYRQELGIEGAFLHDAVALTAAVHPELFDTDEMAGDVELSGELTTGATIFDRRDKRRWNVNMEVATSVDANAVIDNVVRSLAEAGRQTIY